MSTDVEMGKVLVERNIKPIQTQNLIVVDDGSNEAKIPGFPYIFRASGDKLLVAVDIFKSGYECKTCKGTGVLEIHCPCEDTSRPGYKYSLEQLKSISNTLGAVVENERAKMICPSCNGDYISSRKEETCAACKGLKTLLHMPDQSKSSPTTGVIVSLGPMVNPILNFHNHDRVLFGQYTGVMIPTKALGVTFKVIRDIEVLCTIKGGEDLAVFDFITIDKDL